MQWSYHLGSTILATTSKFKIAVEIGVFRLIHEALYFCSTITATTSKFKMAVEIGVFRLIREALYFFTLIFTSHRNWELYELLWELQIDVSIIY